MKLHRLTLRDRRQMAAALRRGEPVVLDLKAPPPPDVRLDDVVPLCHAVQAWSPEITRRLEVFLPPGAQPGHPAQVTAVIPTHRQTPLALNALRGQDVSVEVLVLANGPLAGASTWPPDGDQVESVPWEGHGLTRQLAVQRVCTEYLLFTVDDGIPQGAGFVRTLVQALEAGGFDAVFARQVPWPDASPVTCAQLRAWTPPGLQVRQVGHLDHVAALYRTETLRRWPLPAVPIAEDLHWAQGRRIGYVPTAPILHSHPRRAEALFLRARAIHGQHLALGEAPRVPSLAALVRALPGIIPPLMQAGLTELPNQLAELLGQWAAARDAGSRP